MKLRLKSAVPLKRIRHRKGGPIVLYVTGIDIADDTRLPRHMALVETVILTKEGRQERALIPPHQLAADTEDSEHQLAAIAELCREALKNHPPSSAKDGVMNPNEDESTSQGHQPGQPLPPGSPPMQET